MKVGIEKLNAFGGSAYLDVMKLVSHRGLDQSRFENLLMKEKAVALPFEDPITSAVNAAKPILDSISDEEKQSIELLITCSESGIDFGKSIGTYVHDFLGLSRNCRIFEIKQACYSGTAGLQMAFNTVLSNTSPGSKALVVATDISRFILKEGEAPSDTEWGYAELTSGYGAVAALVGDAADVLRVDVGANGYYGYEVMDTCRPAPDIEAGNPDLSLLSYLDCCENAFRHYQSKVDNVSFMETFNFLAFHTPFGGMVKGAHRSLARKLEGVRGKIIEQDFDKRLRPSLNYCQRVGNILGATSLLAIASTIDNVDFNEPVRLGCFSYGSGCCSEFYSGVITLAGKEIVASMKIDDHLENRYELSMQEYDQLLRLTGGTPFGTKNAIIGDEYRNLVGSGSLGRETLYLTKIDNYHREYQWA